MKTIHEIRSDIKPLHEEMLNELKGIFDKYGYNIGIASKNIKFDETGWDVRLAIKVKNFDSTGAELRCEKNDKIEFEKGMELIGVNTDGFGKEVKLNKRIVKVCGYKPRNVKYPIIVQEVATGKKFKVGLDWYVRTFS